MKTKVWITAYDFFSGRVAENSGVDTILVGDSLGMTVYGDEDTTQMTKEIMRRHYLAVKKGAPNTRIILDFPFGADTSLGVALKTAQYFASENSGVKYFKIEGDADEKTLKIFSTLVDKGFEIVAHLGLQPQKLKKSNWKVQGKNISQAEKIKSAVKKFEKIGIKEIVLECVPETLATEIQAKFSGDIIGIGAGRNVNAQVLVFDDVIGRTISDFSPRFVQKFGDAKKTESLSVQKYISAVQEKIFPSKENVF